MLTGNSSKSWNIAEVSYDATEENEICKSSSTRNQDNKWIFFKSGDLEFDNGEITEDLTCDSEGCCSDIINLYGTWEFSPNGENLIITAIGSLEDGEKLPLDEPEEIFDAHIDKLTDSELVLSQGDTVKFIPVD